MELIDTHCHLTFNGLYERIDTVLDNSKKAGVTGWVVVGTEPEENLKVVDLARRYDDMYAAVGIHPHYADNVKPEDIDKLEELAGNEKVVAIGETGFDFYYDNSSPEAQKELFIKHLKLAQKHNLPVIIHSREAFDETINILDEYFRNFQKLVFHCFGGNDQQAKDVLARGYYISFTGVVTFKNAEKARQAAKAVPVKKLMLETDCPFMSPVPVRNQRPNEPGLMVHTAEFLAKLKEIDKETLGKEIFKTSKEFFGI